jgi:hypothetical protein
MCLTPPLPRTAPYLRGSKHVILCALFPDVHTSCNSGHISLPAKPPNTDFGNLAQCVGQLVSQSVNPSVVPCEGSCTGKEGGWLQGTIRINTHKQTNKTNKQTREDGDEDGDEKVRCGVVTRRTAHGSYSCRLDY